MLREAPYRCFIKVFLHFPTVLQGTVPFPANKVLILKDKIHRTLSVHTVKRYTQGYQFMSDVIRLHQASCLPFLYFACGLKLFPRESKGLSFFPTDFQ